MTKVAILQSNYIPWKGYFELIGNVDTFIFLDNVQYTKNDWRNRNKIITDKGLDWITIPINNSINEKINEKNFIDARWKQKHYKTISQNYSKSPFFQEYHFLLDYLYLNNNYENLSVYNTQAIKFISQEILKFKTIFGSYESEKEFVDPNHRLLEILKLYGAKTYVTGPSAAAYLDDNLFLLNGIEIQFFKYGPYKPYKQRGTEFIDHVSILDTVFNCGSNIREYILSI